MSGFEPPLPGPVFGLALALTALTAPAAARAGEADVFALDLAQLSELEVVTVSPFAETWREAPASLYVISRDQIARSGAENITDLLQRVPGLFIRQLNRQRVASSSRNDTQIYYANLLLLIDGEPYYPPSISAPYWQSVDLTLAEIERIEVVRGSGGPAWGSNSSGGVVNIITRRAVATEASRVAAGVGTQRRRFAAYESSLGSERHAWRLGLQAEADDGFADGEAQDNEELYASLRYDGRWGPWDVLWTARALDASDDERSVFTGRSSPGGSEVANTLFTARRGLGENDRVEARLSYYDSDTRVGTLDFLFATRWWDAELHHSHEAGSWRGQWGLSSRRYHSESVNTPFLAYSGTPFDDALNSLFALWQGAVGEDWRLDISGRAERYTLIEPHWLPSWGLRLGYQALPRWFWWASANRGWQMPALSQVKARFLGGFTRNPAPALVFQVGSEGLDPERIDDLQMGLRWFPGPRHWLELAFYAQRAYDQIYIDPNSRRFRPGTPLGEVSLAFDNIVDSRGHGAELQWDYQAGEDCRVETGLSYFRETQNAPGRPSITAGAYAPEFKLHVAGDCALDERHRLAAVLSWEDAYTSELGQGLFAPPASYTTIAAHYRLDLAWTVQLGERWQLQLSAKNLLQHAVEWDAPAGWAPPQEVAPSYQLGLSLELP